MTEPQPKNPFFPGYFTGKTRPSYNDKEVKILVIEQIMPEILRWLNDNKDTDNNKEEITKDLIDIIGYYKDGYKMAKDLDDRGWDSDSELVEILDNLDFHDIVNKLSMLWLKDNNIQPKFKIGDLVRIKSRLVNSSIKKKEYYIGEITKIDPFGKYVVFIEEAGHVRVGCGTNGSYINWEDVELYIGESL